MRNDIIPSPSLTLLPVNTPGSDMTAVRSWLRSKNSPHTKKAYVQDITVFYQQVGKSIGEVTLPDLQDYDEWIRCAYSSVDTQRRMLYVIKSLLTFAQKQGYIPFNVGSGLTPPKAKDTLAERILTPAQIQHIIYEAKKSGSQRNYVLILLLYASGIRCEELCNLQWKDAREQGDTGQITVFGKERETRAVLLHQKAWKALQTIKPDQDNPEAYIFATRQLSYHNGVSSYRMTEARVWQIVSRIARVAGIKASPHFFRHAHATHTMGKASQRVIQETMGWKSPMVMMRYQHVMPSESSSFALDL